MRSHCSARPAAETPLPLSVTMSDSDNPLRVMVLLHFYFPSLLQVPLLTNSTADPYGKRDSRKCYFQISQVDITQTSTGTWPTHLSSFLSSPLHMPCPKIIYTSFPSCPTHALPLIWNALALFFSWSTLI